MKKIISITIEPKLLKTIDKLRDGIPRSVYISNILDENVKEVKM